jgi:hypothetical protein
VTTIIADQNHEQHVGIEHIAIETDDCECHIGISVGPSAISRWRTCARGQSGGGKYASNGTR